jgi:histidine triad (HIT) family protein
MRDCPFCTIALEIQAGVRKPLQAWSFWGELDAFAITPLNPVTKGHTLIIPRVHVPLLVDSPLLFGRMAQAAAEYAERFNECNVITSMGVNATQTIFHVHTHIVPRRPGDGLLLPWSNQQA